MTTVPGDLVWQTVRKNNSFMVKQFGNGHAKVLFTKEPNNLYNIHSYKYSGQLPHLALFLTLIPTDHAFCNYKLLNGCAITVC
jgi:hypothetical protein